MTESESTSTSTSKQLDSNNDTDKIALANVHLPRISIQFCTQCRWMLRAAYVRGYLSFLSFLTYHIRGLFVGSFLTGVVFDSLFLVFLIFDILSLST